MFLQTHLKRPTHHTIHHPQPPITAPPIASMRHRLIQLWTQRMRRILVALILITVILHQLQSTHGIESPRERDTDTYRLERGEVRPLRATEEAKATDAVPQQPRDRTPDSVTQSNQLSNRPQPFQPMQTNQFGSPRPIAIEFDGRDKDEQPPVEVRYHKHIHPLDNHTALIHEEMTIREHIKPSASPSLPSTTPSRNIVTGKPVESAIDSRQIGDVAHHREALQTIQQELETLKRQILDRIYENPLAEDVLDSLEEMIDVVHWKRDVAREAQRQLEFVQEMFKRLQEDPTMDEHGKDSGFFLLHLLSQSAILSRVPNDTFQLDVPSELQSHFRLKNEDESEALSSTFLHPSLQSLHETITDWSGRAWKARWQPWEKLLHTFAFKSESDPVDSNPRKSHQPSAIPPSKESGSSSTNAPPTRPSPSHPQPVGPSMPLHRPSHDASEESPRDHRRHAYHPPEIGKHQQQLQAERAERDREDQRLWHEAQEKLHHHMVEQERLLHEREQQYQQHPTESTSGSNWHHFVNWSKAMFKKVLPASLTGATSSYSNDATSQQHHSDSDSTSNQHHQKSSILVHTESTHPPSGSSSTQHQQVHPYHSTAEDDHWNLKPPEQRLQ